MHLQFVHQKGSCLGSLTRENMSISAVRSHATAKITHWTCALITREIWAIRDFWSRVVEAYLHPFLDPFMALRTYLNFSLSLDTRTLLRMRELLLERVWLSCSGGTDA